MTTSDAGKLVSPGELGFILRPFSFDPRGEPVDFRTRTALDPTTAKDDSDAYFRTIRLYDHDPANPADKITKAQDPVYDNFVVQAEDGSAPGSRVTPLSESPVVLAAAVEQTPVDYWFATRDVKADRTIMMDNTFNTLLGTSDWPKFRKAWLNCLTNCVKKTASTGQLIRNSWQHGLPEYYGNYDKFGWYSAGVPDEIFASGTPAFALHAAPRDRPQDALRLLSGLVLRPPAALPLHPAGRGHRALFRQQPGERHQIARRRPRRGGSVARPLSRGLRPGEQLLAPEQLVHHAQAHLAVVSGEQKAIQRRPRGIRRR
jgi:hypothetical protein